MWVVDDHAAAVGDNQVVEHALEGLAPGHCGAHVDAVLVQDLIPSAVVIAAGEGAAWRGDMQIDIVVRKTVVLRIGGFQEIRGAIWEETCPFVCGQDGAILTPFREFLAEIYALGVVYPVLDIAILIQLDGFFVDGLVGPVWRGWVVVGEGGEFQAALHSDLEFLPRGAVQVGAARDA